MNTSEQYLGNNRHNLTGDETLITRASQRTPVRSTGIAARTGHWHFVVFIFLMSLGEIAALFFLLRGVPADLLHHEFEGLGTVVCVLAYIGLFVRQVSRALAQDTRQVEESNHPETSPITRAPSQRGPQQNPSGNATRGCEPVELRT